ncbi:MAG: hypothetical protein V3T70_02595 [Phycisphaerae bacterium]
MPLVLEQTGPRNAGATIARVAQSSGQRRDIHWGTIDNDDGMARLASPWSALAAQASTTLFVTPEWIRTWYGIVAPEVQPRVGAGLDDSGRLVAVWPLGLRSIGIGPAVCRVLEPMGGAVVSGDRLDPLLADPALAGPVMERVARLASTASTVRRRAHHRGDPGLSFRRARVLLPERLGSGGGGAESRNALSCAGHSRRH